MVVLWLSKQFMSRTKALQVAFPSSAQSSYQGTSHVTSPQRGGRARRGVTVSLQSPDRTQSRHLPVLPRGTGRTRPEVSPLTPPCQPSLSPRGRPVPVSDGQGAEGPSRLPVGGDGSVPANALGAVPISRPPPTASRQRTLKTEPTLGASRRSQQRRTDVHSADR